MTKVRVGQINFCYNVSMSISFNTLKKKPLFWLYAAGVVLLAVGGWLWWTKLCLGPEQVFWKTLQSGLATSGVTIQAEQATNGTLVHQTMQYALGVTNVSHTRTSLSQQGTHVVNELIGTPTADYTRYASIKTDQKTKDGKPLDVSKIVGVWAKEDKGKGQVFPQAVLGASLPLDGMGMPIGSLAPKSRAKLIDQIHKDKVYQVAFGKVKKEHAHGRLQYTYDVQVRPAAYTALMKKFAQSLGLHDLDKLDPARFKDQPATKLRITIDARSQRVVKVAVPDSNYSQTYGGYGLPVHVSLPKQTITVDELQKRLSKLQ